MTMLEIAGGIVLAWVGLGVIAIAIETEADWLVPMLTIVASIVYAVAR